MCGRVSPVRIPQVQCLPTQKSLNVSFCACCCLCREPSQTTTRYINDYLILSMMHKKNMMQLVKKLSVVCAERWLIRLLFERRVVK